VEQIYQKKIRYTSWLNFGVARIHEYYTSPPPPSIFRLNIKQNIMV
jgi:hypothetical protein